MVKYGRVRFWYAIRSFSVFWHWSVKQPFGLSYSPTWESMHAYNSAKFFHNFFCLPSTFFLYHLPRKLEGICWLSWRCKSTGCCFQIIFSPVIADVRICLICKRQHYDELVGVKEAFIHKEPPSSHSGEEVEVLRIGIDCAKVFWI